MSGASHLMGVTDRPERPQGLPVSVILLRRDGQRITGEEFRTAVPLMGYLLLGPTSRHRTGGGASHMAEVIRPGAVATGSVCKPIFNPVIEKVDHRGFVLSGYEVALQNEQPMHLEQVWLVRPLTAADPFSG